MICLFVCVLYYSIPANVIMFFYEVCCKMNNTHFETDLKKLNSANRTEFCLMISTSSFHICCVFRKISVNDLMDLCLLLGTLLPFNTYISFVE